MTEFERKNPPGEIEVVVRENVKLLRGRMTYRDLSDRLAQAGAPIPVLGLSRIEAGNRRITVDELVAFAGVFGVEAASLLVPLKVVHKIHIEVA